MARDTIVTGEVIGNRLWAARKTEMMLRSVIRTETVWYPQEPLQSSHPMSEEWQNAYVPQNSGLKYWHHSKLGIHAFKSSDKGIRWLRMADSSIFRRFTVVLGRVELWGDVIEHRDGYRADYAYPVGFDAVVTLDRKIHEDEILDQLRKVYL